MEQPPRLINYPMHEHPLELINSMTVYPEHNGEWNCDNCTMHQTNSHQPYHCSVCQFDVCIKCALPVEHPLHPNHTLYLANMASVYMMYNGQWKCDCCGIIKEPSLAYHCYKDQFDLCQQCFVGQHFPIHRHRLVPVDAAQLYNNAPGWWACDSCKRQGTEIQSRFSWHCSQCEFDCCRECLRDILIPVHEHPLRLTDARISYPEYEGAWKCDGCKKEFSELVPEPVRGRPYHCSACNFDICYSCLGIEPDHPRDETGPPIPGRHHPMRQNREHHPPTEISDDDEIPENLDDEKKCNVCMIRPKNATIVHGSTGHVCCCLSCAYTLQKRGDHCPICRASIDRVIKHFNS